jgi:hypothetical protein
MWSIIPYQGLLGSTRVYQGLPGSTRVYTLSVIFSGILNKRDESVCVFVALPMRDVVCVYFLGTLIERCRVCVCFRDTLIERDEGACASVAPSMREKKVCVFPWQPQ